MTQNKKFKHKEKEVCALTFKEIDTTKDDYVIVLSCRKKDIKNVRFFKVNDYNNLISGNLQALSRDILKKAGTLTQGILNQLGLNKEVFVIK